MTHKERATILFNKYSKEYNRFIVAGYIKQEIEGWKEISIELGMLYQSRERAKNYMRLKKGYKE